MAKQTNPRSDRDIRSLLHVPQHDLQAQVASRLERLGFPALRPAQVLLLTAIGTVPIGPNVEAIGLRLSDLVTAVALPKQTVSDLLDDLETLRLVERFPDPDHGVIKRVRLGVKGKVWAAEVRRVSTEAEARWATRLGSKKMKSLRALLEELATTVEHVDVANGHAKRARTTRR